MDYESGRLLVAGPDESINDLCDSICNQTVSRFVVYLSAILYIIITLLAGFVNVSNIYDITGAAVVFIVICSQIRFSGRNVRSVIHFVLILLWAFMHGVLSAVYLSVPDLRFRKSTGLYRMMLFAGQGIQLASVVSVSIIMFHQERHTKLKMKRSLFTFFMTVFGWILALIGLITSSIYAKQLRQFQRNYDRYHWHYLGEMVMWIGLGMSAMTANTRMMTLKHWILLSPFLYLVPLIYFRIA